MECYGEQLRRFRGRRSQKDTARALGITEEALAAYEAGKRMPRDEVKKRIQAWMQGEKRKTPQYELWH